MPGKHKRSNPFLLLIAILMCLSPCLLLTQSAADPARINGEISSEDPFAPEPSEDSNSVTDNPKASSTPSATPTTAPAKPKVSKEAASGIWTSSGSDWLFMVDGQPYTGWLIDTDGKHYYFNSDGIMQTGWLDDRDKRYYLDLDGIMQTGDKTIDGKEYHFAEDGSLEK